MTPKPLIVLVEDDAVIAELIEYNLISEGYLVSSYRNGTSLLEGLPSLKGICLFILDIMLPGMDGFEICRQLRQGEEYALVPILMLTARGTESDKVRGLEAGADDYITKPFGIREFLARIQAHTRRYLKSNPTSGGVHESDSMPKPVVSEAKTDFKVYEVNKLEHHGIRIDDVKHRVFLNNSEVDVTHREYELLKFLMQNSGVAYSRDDLLNHVWGYEYSGETRTVDVHIRQLRRKIEQDDKNPVIIETVRGRGYRFCE